jgi:glycosyltransferase involved in cell wall biosynthesis
MTQRILFVIHTPPDPGTAVFLSTSRTAAHLRELGHSVEILTPSDLPLDVPRLRPLTFPFLVLLRAPWRYDMVVFHSHAGWAFHVLARWLAWLPLAGPRRTRTITTFHGLEPLYHAAVQAELARRGERQSARFRLLHTAVVPRLLRASCRRSDRVLCLNRAERDYLVEHGWCAPERVGMVANGVEPDFFIEPVHDGTGRALLFLGQWLPAKGTRYLSQAFSAIAEARRDAALVCVGTGAPAEVVLADFDPSVRDRVRVVPRVDRAGLLRELGRADVQLLPTLSEGFSGALIEGMAAGRGIVATPAGAAPDLLVHDVNAVVVPFADAEALAGAAIRLLADGPARRRLGLAAARTARAYTWAAVSERYRAELMRGRDPVRADASASHAAVR